MRLDQKINGETYLKDEQVLNLETTIQNDI